MINQYISLDRIMKKAIELLPEFHWAYGELGGIYIDLNKNRGNIYMVG